MQPYSVKKDVIFNEIKNKILSKEYRAGYKFPSEPEFARELGIGRITLRSAMERLEKAGLVFRMRAKGTFVSGSLQDKKKEKRFLVLLGSRFGNSEYPTSYILPAFEKACESLGIEVERLYLDFLRTVPDAHAVSVLQNGNYNGIMLQESYYHGHEKEIRILQQLKKPVLISHSAPSDTKNTGFATMLPDYRQSWKDGIKHLIERGHQRIATLGMLCNGQENLRGFEKNEYLKFLSDEGADPDTGLLKFAENEPAEINEVVSSLMNRLNPPTAIMCFSDFYAIKVYGALDKLGLKIPDDAAVMGYCGYPGDYMLSPPLSTVDLGYAAIGRQAAETLARAEEWFCRENTAVPRIVTPHRVVQRESTGIKRMEKKLTVDFQ